MSDPTVLSRRDRPVGRVILHRPAKLNALDRTMLEGLVGALRRHDDDPDVRVVILSGTARAFAAGADIGTLGEVGAMELYRSGFSEHWDAVAAIRTPIIAAVSGYVLGGGLELALTCDVVMCERSAVFGFPETAIGTIPGAGGTQRLVHAVGKSMAMEMILAGRRLDADEARAAGLVSTISEIGEGEGAALSLAQQIAERSPLAVAVAKQAVLQSFEMPLSAGIRHERVLSALMASSEDRDEGMKAFLGKRVADFKGR